MDSSSLSMNISLNLDNLPPEIYYFYLFEYLDIDDILEFRFVCKKLYSIVKAYDITELGIGGDFRYDKEKWFSTSKSTKFRNQLDFSSLFLLKNPPINFFNLKYLKINILSLKLVKFKDLNKFTRLQILLIDRIDIIHGDISNDYLQLNNLVALSLGGLYIINNLIIDAPNLQALKINNGRELVENIILKHPLSVKHLKVIIYSKHILLLKNLECLEIWEFKNMNRLLKLKNLKAIKFIYHTNCNGNLSRFFLNLRLNPKFNDLQIFLHEIRIKEVDMIAESEDGLGFIFNNLSELDELNSINCINYIRLIYLLPDHTPSDLFKKLTSIRSVRITYKLNDENRLINFIKEFPNLCDLYIDCESMSQQFYDNLPPWITFLHIDHDFDTSINFEFIMKMTYLSRLDTNQDIIMNENLNFNKFKGLKILKFVIKGVNIETNEKRGVKVNLGIEGKDKYSTIYHKSSDLPDKMFYSYNELVEYFNYLRNDYFVH